MKNDLLTLGSTTVIVAALLTGCSGDDASESNFESVISDYYSTQDAPATCLASELDRFPYEVPRRHINYSDVSLEDKLSAFLDAELIEKTGQSQYSLTDEGKAYFTPKKGFCFGRLEVSEVSNFTDPTSNGKYTVSRVNYTVEVADRPDWSKLPSIVNTFSLSDDGLRTSGFLSRNDNPEQKNMSLVKTNDGWVTQYDVR